jgi:hypothetical protein
MFYRVGRGEVEDKAQRTDDRRQRTEDRGKNCGLRNEERHKV